MKITEQLLKSHVALIRRFELMVWDFIVDQAHEPIIFKVEQKSIITFIFSVESQKKTQ